VLFYSDQSLNERTYTSFSQAELEKPSAAFTSGPFGASTARMAGGGRTRSGAWVFENFLKPR